MDISMYKGRLVLDQQFSNEIKKYMNMGYDLVPDNTSYGGYVARVGLVLRQGKGIESMVLVSIEQELDDNLRDRFEVKVTRFLSPKLSWDGCVPRPTELDEVEIIGTWFKVSLGRTEFIIPEEYFDWAKQCEEIRRERRHKRNQKTKVSLSPRMENFVKKLIKSIPGFTTGDLKILEFVEVPRTGTQRNFRIEFIRRGKEHIWRWEFNKKKEN